MRSPSPYLAIDETMYPYRGSTDIKKYNPSKPVSMGFSIAAYVMLLCLIRTIHSHVPVNHQKHEASKYYISGTDEYTKYLENGVNHYNSIDGSNISMDRYFTLVTITQ